MKKTERLWRTLEATPVLSGVRAAWKEIAGEDLPALQPFLRPSADLASTYPCPEPGDDGCPRGVLIHAPDDIVAVCRRTPRSCEKLKLSKDDIVIYTLDLPKIAAQLRALFGLAGDGTPPVDGLARTLHLGTYRPAAGLAFPVYMSIQNDRDDLAGVIERLAARDARSFILIAPTTDLVGPRSAELLRTRGAIALGLADFTQIDKDGKLVLEKPVKEVLKSFPGKAISTPPTAVQKKAIKKRASRTAAIDAIKQALREHMRAARDHAYTRRDHGKDTELLPRPTMQQLADQLKLHISSVSRAINDSADREIAILWAAAQDLGQVMKFKG